MTAVYLWNITNPAQVRAARKAGGVKRRRRASPHSRRPSSRDARPPHAAAQSHATAQVLAGEPPQLSEVGPFTIQRTTANYNIRFDDARRRMDWQWLIFDELVPEKSCDVCTRDALVSAFPASPGASPPVTRPLRAAQIYAPNAVYAGIMQTYGWSEVPLLLQFVPVRLACLCMRSLLRLRDGDIARRQFLL